MDLIKRITAVYALLSCFLYAGGAQAEIPQGPTGITVDSLIVMNTPWRDIRAYGAVGDGVSDDSAALQNALNSGGNILVPAGYTFVTGSSLSIPSDSTLTIDGTIIAASTLDAPVITAAGATRVKLLGTGTINVNASKRSSVQKKLAAVMLDDCTLCEVNGLTVLGDRRGGEGGTGNNGIIHLNNCTDSVVEGVKIYHSPIDGIFITGGSRNAVRNNNGYNIRGSMLGSNSSPTHLSVSGNFADACGYTCISVNGDYSVVKGNIAKNSAYSGISLGHDTATSHAHNSIVAANISEGNTLDGISIAFSHHSIISDNVAEGNARKGIYVQFQSTHANGTAMGLLIKGNNLTNNTGGGIYIRNHSGPGHIIEGNNCSGNGASGIYVEHSYTGDDSHIIKNNRCSNNGSAGLVLYSATNCVVEGNVLNSNATYGLLVSGGGSNLVTNNLMQGNTTNELYQTRQSK
jgi:parallel beta-helix repeat protein